MGKTLRKFIFCSPVTPIYEIHKYRPYFEFPKAASRFGFEPYLIIGKSHFKNNSLVRVIETGIDSNRHIDVPKILPFLLKCVMKERPQIFVFFHMNIVLPIIVSVTKFFGWGRRTKFVLKMDWDGGSFKQLGKFMVLRNVLLAIESFFVDIIIIENTCGHKSLSSIPFINKDKIVILPNGYSEDFIQRANYADFERQHIILTVSRVSPEKGLDILISAFSVLSFEFPEWKLKIVGPVEDTAYHMNCISLIEKFDLQSRILFTGALYGEPLKWEYYHASIFCLPSIEESYGIVRLEAIAAGLPLVTSEAGCGQDFERFGTLVFRNGNTTELTKCLRILMTSEKIRIEISERQQKSLVSYDKIIETLLVSLGECYKEHNLYRNSS